MHTRGALGRTRTGTPKWARILSPLCLPISPRGLSLVLYRYLMEKQYEFNYRML